MCWEFLFWGKWQLQMWGGQYEPGLFQVQCMKATLPLLLSQFSYYLVKKSMHVSIWMQHIHIHNSVWCWVVVSPALPLRKQPCKAEQSMLQMWSSSWKDYGLLMASKCMPRWNLNQELLSSFMLIAIQYTSETSPNLLPPDVPVFSIQHNLI